MKSYLRQNHLGAIALFIALSASTAYAMDGPLAGQNTVGSEDIIGNEIKSDDIGNGRIFNLDFADNSIGGEKIKDESLTGADFATDSIGGPEIDEAQLGFTDGEMAFGFGAIPGGVEREILHRPHQFTFSYSCPDPATNAGTLTFSNLRSHALDLFVDTGAENPTYARMAAGEEAAFPMPAASAELRFSFRTQFNSFGIVSVVSRHTTTGCHPRAQGWLSSF